MLTGVFQRNGLTENREKEIRYQRLEVLPFFRPKVKKSQQRLEGEINQTLCDVFLFHLTLPGHEVLEPCLQ